MRILQISSAGTFGGGEKHFVDLCRGLSESGDDIHIAVRPRCEWISKMDFLPPDKIHRLALLNAADLISAARLTRIIRRNRIEIVHAHLARDYPLAALAVRGASFVRLVLTRHVMFPLKNVHKLLLSNVSAAIGVSDAAAGNLQKLFAAEKVFRVYNGLDPTTVGDPESARREFRFENNISFDDIVITCVGTFKRLKGQLDLITAAARLLPKYPNAFFVFIGKDASSNKSYQGELQSHATSLEVADRVLFHDWVDDMGRLMAATDVFVSPSHSESFGLATLEAMAYGKPVVSTATSGAKELISDENDGVLVPVKDPEALAGAIIRIIADAKLREVLAKNAELKAKEQFSLKKMIMETKAVYEDVLNK